MKRPVRAALALLIAVLLGIACNAAAFLIDTPSMREHAAQGAAMLGEQLGAPQLVGGFRSAQLDNFTSVLILKTAAYTGGESLLFKTFGGYRADVYIGEGQTDWEAFCTYADGRLSDSGGLSYTRYWHGYTLPLRLLLCVFNLSNIQMLLLFAQMALFACVLLGMRRRGLGALMPGLFTAYFLLMPMALGICLQYAPVSLLALASCVMLLSFDGPLESGIGMPAFFALVGLTANYLDLLTFPLITLGFPLVLLLSLRLREGESGPRLLLLAAACCAGWSLGYGGMWALKWLLTALVFGRDMLSGIFEQMTLRVSSSSGGTDFSRLGVLALNLEMIVGKSSYLLLLALTAAATLMRALRGLRDGLRVRLDARALVMLLPAAAPLLWAVVMANHSFDHAFYTYRNLTVSVLSLYALIACLPAAGPKKDR